MMWASSTWVTRPGSQLGWRRPTGWVGQERHRGLDQATDVLLHVYVQVSVTYSANETQPGQAVDLRVRAARGSCVCVAAVDKSVYLLRPGFRLTPAQVSAGLWAAAPTSVEGLPSPRSPCPIPLSKA